MTDNMRQGAGWDHGPTREIHADALTRLIARVDGMTPSHSAAPGPAKLPAAADCTCHHTCAEDPQTRCSLSGDWHVHPGEPCPVHPNAPGDH